MTTNFEQQRQEYLHQGWLKFEHDQPLLDWVSANREVAMRCLLKDENKQWWRYQNTWFVGVNVLNNDGRGRVSGSQTLEGVAVDFIAKHYKREVNDLDRAQVSVFFEGYPQAMEGESQASLRYRRKRDAAHMDGLLLDRVTGQRYAKEFHQYVFAVPLNEAHPNASPFVVWSGSHKAMRDAFSEFFAGVDVENWPNRGVNEIYQARRKWVFEHCQREEVLLKPGESLLANRFLLHGTAPWTASKGATPEGRAIAFFRPHAQQISQWLAFP